MNVFLLLIVLLGVPVGLLVAWIARDELRLGRKWFVVLSVLSLLVGIALLLSKNAAGAATCFFILAMALVSWRKSHDKRWTCQKLGTMVPSVFSSF